MNKLLGRLLYIMFTAVCACVSLIRLAVSWLPDRAFRHAVVLISRNIESEISHLISRHLDTMDTTAAIISEHPEFEQQILAAKFLAISVGLMKPMSMLQMLPSLGYTAAVSPYAVFYQAAKQLTYSDIPEALREPINESSLHAMALALMSPSQMSIVQDIVTPPKRQEVTELYYT